MRAAPAPILAAVAVAAALWCLFLAPIQSAIWNAGEPGPEPLVVVVLRPLIAIGDAVYAALGSVLGTPYEFWGRLFAPVYAGMLAALALVARADNARGVRLARAAIVVALIADAASYWSHDTALGFLWGAGFGIELGALLLTVLGVIVISRSQWVAGERFAGVMLLAGVLLIVPSYLVVRYVPHGAVLPMAVALAVVATSIARRPTAAAGTVASGST